MAADSKVYESTERICKLFRSGPIYWSMSGAIDANGPYNLPAIIASSREEGKTLSGTFDSFQKKIISPLLWEARREREAGEAAVKKFGVQGLDIAFFGFENGIAFLAHLDIRWEIDPKTGKKGLVPYPNMVAAGTCSPPSANGCAALLGVRTEAKKYLDEHSSWPRDLVSSGIEGIRASIRENSEAVGPPIRIWTIKSDNSVEEGQNGCPVRSAPPPAPPASRHN